MKLLSLTRTAAYKRCLKLESIKGRREVSWGKSAVIWSCCYGWPVKAASHPSDMDLTVHAHKRQMGTIWTSNCKHWNEHTEFAEINYVYMCSSDCLKLYTDSVVTWRVIFFSLVLNPNTKTSRVKYSINCYYVFLCFSKLRYNWHIILRFFFNYELCNIDLGSSPKQN